MEKDYSFHGIYCDQITFAVWMAKKLEGRCPFCDRQLSNKYGSLDKHIKSCKNRLKMGIDQS